MSRDQGPERKADQSKEGDSNKPTTSHKVASEGVTNETQAPRYEPKFRSFSGAHDQKLHAHQFVIEDKEKGVHHTAYGEKKVGQSAERQVDKAQHPKPAEHKVEEQAEHKPRASFLAGLKQILDSATNPKEAEAKQAEFSIAYMLRKAQELMDAAMGKQPGDRKDGSNGHQGDAHQGGGHHGNDARGPAARHETTAAKHETAAAQIHSHATIDKSPPLTPQEARTLADGVKHTLNDWSLARIMNGGKPDVEALGNILQPLSKSKREQVDQAFRAMNDGQGIEQAGAASLNGDNAAIARLHSIMTSKDNDVDNAGLLDHSFKAVNDSGAFTRNVDLIAAPLGALPGPWQAVGQAFAAFHKSTDQSHRLTEESTILRTLMKLDHHELSANTPIGEMVREQINKHPENFSSATLQAMKTLIQEREKPLKEDTEQATKLAELGLSSHRLDIFQDAMRACPDLRETYKTPAKEAQLRQAFPDDLDFNIARDYAQRGHLGMATKMEGGAHFINPNKATIEEAIANSDADEAALFKHGFELWHSRLKSSSTPDEVAAKNYYERINLAMKRASTFDENQIHRWEQTLLGEAPKIRDTLKQFEENPLEKIFHNSSKSASTIEALAGMTPEEQQRFRTDKEFQQKISDVVANNLKPGVEQDLANRVLKDITDRKPVHFDAYDKIILNHLKGVPPTQSVELFETAVKDKKRLHAGASEEDRQVKAVIEGSVIALVHGAGIADTQNNDIGKGYAKQFLETGHLTTRVSWSIPGNERKLSDILNANQEERNILMHNSPLTAEIELRDRVLGDGEKREFIRYLLHKNEKTGHRMHSFEDLSPADRVRAFVVGCGEPQESLAKYLQTLSRAQIAQMNSDYMRETGHILSKDVTEKLSLEGQSQFVMLVSNVDVAPGEAANRAQITHDLNSSPTDYYTDHLWSLKKFDAQEQIDQMNDAIAKYGSNLKPAQKEELKERLQNYYKAESDFANSKAGAAKALVDASVSLATLSVSLMGAEVTVPFMLAAGAGGGLYSIGVHSVIEGNRFKMDGAHLSAAGGEGFAAAFSGLAGGETFGLTGVFSVSESAANQVARSVLAKGTYGTLKPNAERIIAQELQHVTEVTATTSPRTAMEKLASKVTEGGATNPKLAEALAEQLQQRVKQSSAHRLEAEKLLINAGTNTANTVTTETIHALTGTVSTDDLMKSLPESTVGGAVIYKLTAMSHSAVKALTTEERVAFICRDRDNRFYAGKGLTVARADGSSFTVSERPHALQSGEKIVLSKDKSPVLFRVAFPEMVGAGGDWPIINPRKSPDVVQSLHPNACAAACVEMVTNGRYKQERMLEELKGHFLPEMLSEYPTADIDMCKIELNKVYGSGWKAGAPATEEEALLLVKSGNFIAEFKHKLKDNKAAAKGHEVVVDGIDEEGLVMIRDPADGERYEMKMDDFLDAWRGRRFLRYFGGTGK